MYVVNSIVFFSYFAVSVTVNLNNTGLFRRGD